MVSNLKADLFTICESWLTVNDCAILNKLTLSGYITRGHCPRSDRMGGGTALLVRMDVSLTKYLALRGRRLRRQSGWTMLKLLGFVS